MTIKNVMGPTKLVEGATTAGAGSVFSVQTVNRVFQAVLHGADASASVAVEVSMDGVHFLTLATITLTASAGSDTTTDGFNSVAPWRFVRARVASISAGASVDVLVGV